MKRTGLVATLVTIAGTTTLAGQVGQGDAAWAAGQYREASAAYHQALADDPGQVRANYRLAILASWENRLDSALILIRRAREAERDDPDVRFAEALILSWAGQYDQAIAKYDSLLSVIPSMHEAELGRARTLAWADRIPDADQAYVGMLERNPNDLQALAGRAQLAAWQGDYEASTARYQEILERSPTSVAAHLGLGRVHYYQGQSRRAAEYLERALALAPDNREVRDLHRTVRAEIRPQVTVTAGWSDDSDDNTNWWQDLKASYLLVDGVTGFASTGLLQASDPLRDGDRSMGEVGATVIRGGYRVTGAFGLRRLSPEGATSRTSGSYRLGVMYRPSRRISGGLGFAHYPFDETANLIGRDLDIDQIDASLDIGLTETLSLSAGGGTAWVSDDNQRVSAVLALTQTIQKHFFVGAFGRVLAYDEQAPGYFTPDRFTVLEARGGYSAAWGGGWSSRLSGGLGIQQVGEGGKGQSEWHAEMRFSRNWAAINRVEVFGSITNSAVSSTTGAFRYGTLGATVRLGL